MKNNELPTVYLHIGRPKTGTTAIQRFMFRNRRELKKAGCFVPDFRLKYNGIGYYRNAHWLLPTVRNDKVYEGCMGQLQDNISLRNSVLEVRKYLNEMKEFRENFEEVNDALLAVQERLKNEGRLKNRIHFFGNHRRKFVEGFQPSNVKVAKYFMDREEEKLFDDEHIPDESDAYFSNEELVRVCRI